MPGPSKPWFRKDRGAWFVTIDGHRHNLGPNRTRAMHKFHELKAQTQRRAVSTDLVVAVCDAFLDWCQKHRAPQTYGWYQSRLQRFATRFPDLTVAELRPFHVQQWIDSYAHGHARLWSPLARPRLPARGCTEGRGLELEVLELGAGTASDSGRSTSNHRFLLLPTPNPRLNEIGSLCQQLPNVRLIEGIATVGGQV